MKSTLLVITLCFFMSIAAMAQHKSITWEQYNLASPGLKPIGQLATKPSKETAPSNWSVGCETLDRDYATFNNYKKYVGELGVKSARIQSGWAKCEPEKGKYQFEWLDSCVYGLKELGVEPWMVLCYGNPLYGADKKLGAKIFTDDQTTKAWLDYVRATVRRYKDAVTEWEIWNEPNLGGSKVNPPEAYANLLMKTVKVIKEEQPDAVIIGFALSGIPLDFPKDVFEVLKANNQETIVDYLTFHPYVQNPDEATAAINALDSLAKSYHPGIKLFQGETGCPSILEWDNPLYQYPWTEISQAKWNARRMANDWVRGIRSSIFTIIDLHYPNILQSFGLIRANLLHEVMYVRPSYYAVQHMVNVLDNNAVPSGRFAYEANTLRGISIEGIKTGSQTGCLLWYSDQIPSDALDWDKVDLTIKNINFKDPVLVEMVTGTVYEIPAKSKVTLGNDTKFRALPLRDSPVWIAERTQVTLK